MANKSMANGIMANRIIISRVIANRIMVNWSMVNWSMVNRIERWYEIIVSGWFQGEYFSLLRLVAEKSQWIMHCLLNFILKARFMAQSLAQFLDKSCLLASNLIWIKAFLTAWIEFFCLSVQVIIRNYTMMQPKSVSSSAWVYFLGPPAHFIKYGSK